MILLWCLFIIFWSVKAPVLISGQILLCSMGENHRSLIRHESDMMTEFSFFKSLSFPNTMHCLKIFFYHIFSYEFQWECFQIQHIIWFLNKLLHEISEKKKEIIWSIPNHRNKAGCSSAQNPKTVTSLHRWHHENHDVCSVKNDSLQCKCDWTI